MASRSSNGFGCSTVTLRTSFCLIVLVIFVLYTSKTLYSCQYAGIRGIYKPQPGQQRAISSHQKNEASQGIYQNGRLKLSPRHICNCTVRIGPIVPPEAENWTSLTESSCSDEATLLGTSQKVVSYSLYVNPNKPTAFDTRYYFGAAGNVEGVKQFYPGWVMRIYSNILLEPNNEMCSVVCSDPIIYYCDARHLPLIGNVTDIDPMRWRFLPIGDPTVEKFVVRDLDSRISQRERDAVNEWEASNYSFHGMRDHSDHGTHILGGMWGGDNTKIGLNTSRNLQTQIIQVRVGGNDQHALSAVIYEHHKKQIIIHDSYLCRMYKDSRPFPTKRKNIHAFVGQPIFRNVTKYYLVQPCPKDCRPADHQDWEFC